MRKYRRIPLELEAMEFKDGMTMEDISNFITCDFGTSTPGDSDIAYALEIETLEGPMYADLGDFIVKGVNGEFWPVKPDIFAKTYEPVE